MATCSTSAARPLALEDLAPGVLIDSPLKDRSTTRRKLHADMALAQKPKSIYERGDVIHLDAETDLQVLFPPAGLERSMADDKAFVLLLESAGTRVLFMSDSGFSTEEWLLTHETALRADILIKGQHAKDSPAPRTSSPPCSRKSSSPIAPTRSPSPTKNGRRWSPRAASRSFARRTAEP